MGVRNYLSSESGAAAAEFAMFAVFLAPFILNAADLGMYMYQRLQVEAAAQAGAQAAYATCQSAPVGSQTLVGVCPSFAAGGAVDNAITSTALGALVTWDATNAAAVRAAGSGAGSDAGPFCPVLATNSLVAQTANCSSTSAPPGYYVKITVRYQFRGLFGGATIASLLPSTITRSSWMRLT
jgi:Flp pilus assembly protein TadG